MSDILLSNWFLGLSAALVLVGWLGLLIATVHIGAVRDEDWEGNQE